MTVKRVLESFFEKYSEEAMTTISKMSGDLTLSMSKFKGFTFTEGSEKFLEYVGGYADYKMERVEESDKRYQSNEAITEHTKSFVRDDLFKEAMLPYTEAGALVENCLKHLASLPGKTEQVQGQLMEAGLDNESVGTVVTIIDDYATYLFETVCPVIDRLLWASGWNSAQALKPGGTASDKKTDFII
jgi:hypothetical protein